MYRFNWNFPKTSISMLLAFSLAADQMRWPNSPATSEHLGVRLLSLTALLEAGRPRSGLRWRLGLSLPGVCSRMVTGCAEWPGVLVARSDGRQMTVAVWPFGLSWVAGVSKRLTWSRDPRCPGRPHAVAWTGVGRGLWGLRMESAEG